MFDYDAAKINELTGGVWNKLLITIQNILKNNPSMSNFELVSLINQKFPNYTDHLIQRGLKTATDFNIAYDVCESTISISNYGNIKIENSLILYLENDKQIARTISQGAINKIKLGLRSMIYDEMKAFAIEQISIRDIDVNQYELAGRISKEKYSREKFEILVMAVVQRVKELRKIHLTCQSPGNFSKNTRNLSRDLSHMRINNFSHESQCAT